MTDALISDMRLLASYGFAPCAQIFVTGPQSYNETLMPEDKEGVRKYISESGAQVVIHGAYVDNPWNGAPRAIANIRKEMEIASYIGATGVIIHLGSGAINNDRLAQVLGEIATPPIATAGKPVTLWLEIQAAKQCAGTFETPEKLANLFDNIRRLAIPSLIVGLCVDTAHLHSCGVALVSATAANEWLAGLPNAPIMFHLNDSAAKLGSGQDRHAVLCEGNLWSVYTPGKADINESGLMAILSWAEKHRSMVILERDPDGVLKDLLLIRRLGFFQRTTM